MNLEIKSFKGLVTGQDDDAPKNSASDLLNVRIGDTRIRPRYGYTTKATAPANFEKSIAFQFISGYSGSTSIREGLSIEKISGTIKPYSVNVTTAARTVITNAGTSLSLADAKYVYEVFNDTAYIVGPGATPGVYSHLLGNNASWTTVQDTSYTAVSNPTLTITDRPLDTRGWAAGDAWTYVSTNGIAGGAVFTPAAGIVSVTGADNDNGVQHRTQFSNTLAAAVDWSKYDYISFVIKAGQIFSQFERTNVAPGVKIAGVWHDFAAADFKEFFKDDFTEVTITIHLKGLAGIAAITDLRFTVGGYVVRNAAGTVCSFPPAILGGTYLEASALAHRLWDGTLDGDGITYAVRYKQSVGPVYSSISQGRVTASEAHGFFASTYSIPLGGRMALTTPVDGSGSYNFVEFLRLMQDNTTWKIIGTVANSGVPQVNDQYEESELTALVTATGTGGTPITPPPPFSGIGMTGLFAFMGRMCWLRGTQLEYSAFGLPLDLYDSNAPTPDPEDTTQPARYILADNYADVAVAGIQAGRVGAIIVGNKGAYAQKGTIPGAIGAGIDTLTDAGVIRGSRGIAGPYALCQYVDPAGVEGVVYADPNGRVWFIPNYTITTDKGIGTAKVSELSRLNPDVLFDYLVTGQFGEFGYTDLADVEATFDKLEGALRFSLGKRAVKLQRVPDSDIPQWLKEEYRLTVPPRSTTISTCGDLSSTGAVASSVADAPSTAWVNTGFPFASDDSYSTSGPLGLGTGKKTDILRMDGFLPDASIPATATITKITYSLERSKIGDLQLTETKVQPRKSGAAWGSNITTSTVLGTTDAIETFEITTGLPTVAEVNSGALGIDLQYSQEDSNADWNDPTKWTFVRTGTTSYTDATATTHNLPQVITATYIGAGVKPSFVNVSVLSTCTVRPNIYTSPPFGSPPVALGTATADNGLGTVVIQAIDSDNILVTASSTTTQRIALTAGVGTLNIPATSSETLNSHATGIQMTETASATLVLYVTDTARVDDVEFKTCYTVTYSTGAVTSGVSWKFMDFLDPNQLWAIRSTGQIDEIAYDTLLKKWIEGSDNRDGGYPMPTPFWQSSWIRPAEQTKGGSQNASILVRVALEKGTHGETITVAASTDRDGTLNAGLVSIDSYKFRVTQQGKAHKVRFTLSESTDSVNVANITLQELSNQYTR